jgi:hypothetical protein
MWFQYNLFRISTLLFHVVCKLQHKNKSGFFNNKKVDVYYYFSFLWEFKKDQMASHKFEEALEVESHVCISSKFLFYYQCSSVVSVYKYIFMARLFFAAALIHICTTCRF